MIDHQTEVVGLPQLLKALILFIVRHKGPIFTTYESAHQAGVLQGHTLKLIIPLLKLQR